ncbi:MAG: Ni/Fe hydrogenase subunit alpha [Phycisphaerae bacterium]|nr:Ni/Fe hydrogenase subunit alpha [Phycisphaerae bacterium]
MKATTSATASPTRVIEVKNLARVEGEGALYVRVAGDEIAEVRLDIFEPPRFFEALLRGRSYNEVPDITARICGICPVAYQMSSCHAVEQAFGVTVGEPLRTLRRLLYCGEWIESHVLHMFLLHAPDFLGYESVVGMAADHRDLVTGALALKKAGNRIVSLFGGREVHPINVRVGGFYALPRKERADELLEELRRNRPFAEQAVRFVAGLKFPELDRSYEFVALRQPTEYPFNEGRIVSSNGLDIPIAAFLNSFHEEHVAHSNALHGRTKDGRPYLVGPLARLNLNFDRLPESLRSLCREIGFTVPCRNNFKSIIARGIETLYAVDHAIEILEQYDDSVAPHLDIVPRAGIGHGCTEAPRGILYHRYDVGDEGLVRRATICPPTAQNQPQIEDDLRAFLPQALALPEEEATLRCEQLIRNYDPCISCATHFLRLHVERTT